ncbi:GDYXXLXY domain-containing protein [Lacinutrix sp. Hel_I_90]|uniref:GDYXXLXY domain-containing protein n=1 Tax=Lacinutrix sp. Hel_I_90 TaxID=1249999 RepID=UPI0018CCA822|nr:GDYXXLXY domain-containing protein [Lacinutrix sp. Hel_I_90]
MKLIYLFMLFVALAITQLFVPVHMIFGEENVLNTGKAYKFKTAPVDPSDPYRGKYITLQYDINSITTNDSIWKRNEAIYVYIEEDSLGFAELVKVSKTPLAIENDYVIAEVNWYDDYVKKVNFQLPFNRFYMEESKAKPAELAFRKAQRDSLPNNVYALVFIKEGKAVLQDVFINDIPIAESAYLKE